MKIQDLQITYIVAFSTGPSVVCTCLIVRETRVPMHTLRLQVLYPINPDFPLVLEGNTREYLGSE